MTYLEVMILYNVDLELVSLGHAQPKDLLINSLYERVEEQTPITD